MKKIISFSILLSLIFSFYSTVNANWNDNYFIVTAYYSPLPDQEYYITGNYEDEKILNGKGIAGASGKAVFSGMLAAPGKYSFGTKIYLDGLGIWVVEDRGWAIVPAGERGYSYDRIDVWMGYGDEWLLRANFWGKRKVYGYTIDSGNTTTLDYYNVPAPQWATTWLQKTGLTHKASFTPEIVKKSDIFGISLGKWSDSDLIEEMQGIFIELWYLEVFSWEYDSRTISAVYGFQIEHNIVNSEYELWAWSYGPKTREKLKDIYILYVEEKEIQEKFLKNITEIQETSQAKAKQYVKNLGIPKYGEVSQEVRELQNILIDLWYFDYKDTARFWNITKTAITRYQIDKDIIISENTIWTGLFGPQTREHITQDLYQKYFTEHLDENELREAYNDSIATNLQI